MIPERPRDPPASIIIGGPMYEMMSRLSLWTIPRRIATIWAITWLPLCVLSSLGGWPNLLAFVQDIPAQVRFLLAAPLLVLGERVIAPRVTEVTAYFTRSGLVTEVDRPRYQAAITALEASCNSALAEAFLVVAAYAAGYFWFRREAAGQAIGWMASQGTEGFKLSAAGWWYAAGSIPVYQFVVYRWTWRAILWFRFLFKVSRLDLRLLPTHPDLSGGLGILAVGQASFAGLIFPVSAVIAAIEGEKIYHHLETFHSIRFALGGIVIVLAIFPLVPLLFFMPRLLITKRLGQLDYGLLSQRYTHLFDQRWVAAREPDYSKLLGTSDIQSLADIQNAFSGMMKLRPIPIDRTSLVMLVIAAGAPMLPLALSEVPLDEVFRKLMGILI